MTFWAKALGWLREHWVPLLIALLSGGLVFFVWRWQRARQRAAAAQTLRESDALLARGQESAIAASAFSEVATAAGATVEKAREELRAVEEAAVKERQEHVDDTAEETADRINKSDL